MARYRVTLTQDLPYRDASAFQFVFLHHDGEQQVFFVEIDGEYQGRSIVEVVSPHPLPTEPHAEKVLRSHYAKGEPNTVDTQVRTIRPIMEPHPHLEEQDASTSGQVQPQAIGAGTSYKVTVQMNSATYNALQRRGYLLYGFKAIKGSPDGQPLVWFQADSSVYGGNAGTVISWTENYAGYTSQQQASPGVVISTGSNYPMKLGQLLTVTSTNGQGTVGGNGTNGAISIYNDTNAQMTCGIAQYPVVGGAGRTAAPLCAVPLYGQQMEVMAPIEQILLMFATDEVNSGTVIEKAFASSIGIDLTSENQRTVTFDINMGWSWQPTGALWAKKYPPRTDLAPLLIQSSPSLAQRKLEAAPLRRVA